MGMIQGDIQNEKLNYHLKLKKIIQSSKSPQTILNYKKIKKIPLQKQILKNRIIKNFKNFKGNYLLFLILSVTIFLIFDLRILIPIFLWSIYFYFVDLNDENFFDIFNFKVEKKYFLYGNIFLSGAFLIFFNTILLKLSFMIVIYCL